MFSAYCTLSHTNEQRRERAQPEGHAGHSILAILLVSLLFAAPASFLFSFLGLPPFTQRALWVCWAALSSSWLRHACFGYGYSCEDDAPATAVWQRRVHYDRAVAAVELTLAFLSAQGFLVPQCWVASFLWYLWAWSERVDIHNGLTLADPDASWETRHFKVVDVTMRALRNIVLLCYLGGAVQVESS